MKFIEFADETRKSKASICVEAITGFEGNDEKTQIYFGPNEPLVVPISYDEFKDRVRKAYDR